MEPEGSGPWSRGASAALLAVAVTAVIAALNAPLLSGLGESVPTSAFHSGHAWMFDHLARIALGERPLSWQTDALAFPAGAELRPIALAPALLAGLLRPVVGPLAAYNLSWLVSPALSGLAMMALARRLSGAGPASCAAAALPFALAPYALGCLASGQVAKLQLWALVLPTLAASSLVSRPGWRPALALALCTLVTTFTSPSIGLLLPFALVTVAALGLRGGRRASLGGALSLGVAALSMLPAWRFYASSAHRHSDAGRVWGTQPALRPELDVDVAAAIARVHGTFLPPELHLASVTDAVHLTYLPWPLLLGGALALALRGPGWGVGAALTGLGAALAMGERVWWGAHPLELGGVHLLLPDHFLRAWGYPLASSGMYYRAIALAVLGLSLLLASAAARLGGRRGLALALVLGLGASAEGVRACAPLFPRAPRLTLPFQALQDMAQDPTPGAVLSLPLEHHGNDAQDALLIAATHGRPTTAAPLVMRRMELEHLRRLEAQLGEALRGAEPRQALRALGFRYVVWHEIQDDGGPGRGELLQALGPPEVQGARAMLWRLEAP